MNTSKTLVDYFGKFMICLSPNHLFIFCDLITNVGIDLLDILNSDYYQFWI